MAGLTLVRTPDDWQAYVNAMASELGVAASQVNWGSGPPQYPSLVASIRTSPARVTSCYVTLADAATLLEAAGYEPRRMGENQQVVAPVSSNEFHKHTAAMLLAIVDELVNVKVTTPERFESIMASKLADVDRWHAEDVEELSLADHTVLSKLFPQAGQ